MEKKMPDQSAVDVSTGEMEAQGFDESATKKLLRKMDWHLIPFMSLIYLLCFLDRTNIGNARLDHLEKDLKLFGLQYNDCLAILFPFYIAAEIPSNIMMKRTRPSIWLTFIMFFWSLAMICQGFVKNYSGLLATRVFLGVFEGGLFPGVNYFISQWYVRHECGLRMAAENESAVIDAWEADEAEKAKKEADKREKLVLSMWKKFLSGLRIVERMRAEYGEDIQLPKKDDLLVTKSIVTEEQSEWGIFKNQTNFEGGFIRDENAYEPSAPAIPASSQGTEHLTGGFLVPSQEDPIHSELIVEHGDNHSERKRPSRTETSYQTPISLTSAIQQPREISNESSNDERGDLSVSDEDVESNTKASSSVQGASKSPRTRKQSAKRSNTMVPTALRQRRRATAETTDDIGDPSPPKATRSAPKRKAARKSDAQIKSHFFSHESNDETDLTDLTDRASPKKVEKVRKATRSGRKNARSGQ